MSFLIDPPWLYANGEAYARLAPESAQGRKPPPRVPATIGGFWLVSVSLYLNRLVDAADREGLQGSRMAATG